MNQPISDKSYNLFEDAKFNVEHALDIYASSYCTFPAQFIYEEEFLKEMRKRSESFHIYLIGYVPKMQQTKVFEKNGTLCIMTLFKGQEFELTWKIPSDLKFIQDGDTCYLRDQHGVERWVDQLDMMRKLTEETGSGCPFMVKYIGQAFGSDGSRNAIDRLLKHETLQKIAVKGVPDDYTLQVIMLEIQTDNRIITVFLPNAKSKDDDGTRCRMGLDKLFGTTDAERVSLYEAALIRYFSPEFNKEFKNSFPSTNLKILQNCYEKDFLALVSEICFDNFPFYLCSESVKPLLYHIVKHDLQKDDERKVFFAFDT